MVHDWQRLVQELSTTDLAIYIVISDYAYGNRASSFPSRQRISEELGLGLSTVKRAIKNLSDHGFLKIKHFRGGDGRMHNSYTIVPKLVASGSAVDPVGGHQRAPTGVTSEPRTGPPVTRKEGEGKKEKGKEGVPSGLPFASDRFAAVWAEYAAHRVEKKKPMTDRAEGMLLKKLSHFTEKDAIEKIELAIANGWTGVVFPDRGDGRAEAPKKPQSQRDRELFLENEARKLRMEGGR